MPSGSPLRELRRPSGGAPRLRVVRCRAGTTRRTPILLFTGIMLEMAPIGEIGTGVQKKKQEINI